MKAVNYDMLMEIYYNKIDKLLHRVRETQSKKIKMAAEVIVDSILNGGAVHVFDTGHIINSELIYRAGGLLLLKPLKYVFNVENPVRMRDNIVPIKYKEGMADFILDASSVAKGDVLIMGSVSGKSTNVIDLALSAKKRGVTLIALTSVDYSSSIISDHSSGKRLYELGDIVLDNCAPIGDAMIDVHNIYTKICPASGISATYIMWALTAEIIENLTVIGKIPSVLKSVNLPEGKEYNDKIQENYQKNGY